MLSESEVTKHHHQPLVLFLFPDGSLRTNLDPAGKMGPFDVLPSSWHLSELIVRNNRVMVMHTIQEVGRVVYTTNLRLQLLWSLKLDQAPGTQCRNFMIFLSLRFYVKSILDAQEVLKLQF